MRKLLLVTGALLVLATAMYGQAEQSAIQARLDSDMERMRGQRIKVVEQKLGTGRNLDFEHVRQQAIEINQLIVSINADVVNMQKGVMSAELNKKLKRLEKLAKVLRQSIE